jgi:hypothetical protein
VGRATAFALQKRKMCEGKSVVGHESKLHLRPRERDMMLDRYVRVKRDKCMIDIDDDDDMPAFPLPFAIRHK